MLFLSNKHILRGVHPQSLHLSLRSFELHILGLCKPSRLQCFLATKHRDWERNKCHRWLLFNYSIVWLQILVCTPEAPKIIRKIWFFFSENVLECKVCILVLVGQVEMLLTFLKLLLLLFFLLGGSYFFCFSRFFVMAMLRTRNRGLVQENKKNKVCKVHDWIRSTTSFLLKRMLFGSING